MSSILDKDIFESTDIDHRELIEMGYDFQYSTGIFILRKTIQFIKHIENSSPHEFDVSVTLWFRYNKRNKLFSIEKDNSFFYSRAGVYFDTYTCNNPTLNEIKAMMSSEFISSKCRIIDFGFSQIK